jgi:serpin B
VRVTDAYEAVLLPYDDERLGFFVVRPTNGTTVRNFAQANDLSEIFDSLERQQNVVVHMPELDKNFNFSLNGILQAMGLNSAFCATSADFDGLVESLLGYPGLFISEVEQVVRIMVDSEGTEAAAVTYIGVMATSMPPPPQLILDFNTPYIYAIYDLQTGVPLFIGILDDK